MDNDIEIFRGKNFSDLCKDIYTNQQSTKNQVDVLIGELRQLIKGVNDALMVVPLIKGYLEVSVKNDDQLVKLAAVVQRIASRQASIEATGGAFELSDEEREQLMEQVNTLSIEEKNNISKQSVDDIVNTAKESLEK
jgi:hypothetical protein